MKEKSCDEHDKLSEAKLGAKIQYYFDFMHMRHDNLRNDYEAAREREKKDEQPGPDDAWILSQYTLLDDMLEEYFMIFDTIVVNRL